MKKLVLVLAVAFGASMVACSNAKEAENQGEEAAVEAVEEVVEVATPDSVAADTAAVEAPADSVAE